MKLSVVTVLYGGLSVLESTLPSWQAASRDDVQFVFVDHSTEAVDPVLNLSSWSTYVWNPKNPGFAEGANSAIQLATADRVLVLNPDVYLTAEALDSLVNCSSPLAAIGLRTGPDLFRGIEFTRWGFYRDRASADSVLVGPSGGGALISLALFAALGGYPDHLFAWGEDAEWALGAYSSGVRTTETSVVLDHVGGHSVASRDGQKFKARLLVRNRIATFRRALGTDTQALLAIPFFLAILLNGFRKLRQGTAVEYFSGIREGLTMQIPPATYPKVDLRTWLELTRVGGKKKQNT